MKTVNNISGALKSLDAYSQAVIASKMVFCAGQIGLDLETSSLVQGGVRAETERIMKNLEAVLKGAGSSLDRIAMTTVFLADINDAPVVNEVYGDFVNTDHPPPQRVRPRQ